MNWWLHPKNRVLVFLALLLIVTASRLGFTHVVPLTLFCMGFAALADALFIFIKTKKWGMPHSAFVTGFILTLIIEPSATWWQIAVIVTAAMALKAFVRPAGRHIFNPAASGLLVGYLLFGLNPAWWAPSPFDPGKLTLANLLVYIPVLLIAYVSAYKLRRYWAVGAYLLVYALLFPVVTGIFSLPNLTRTLFSVGTLFYAIVMLIEPKTSPSQKNKQLAYGALVAALTVGLVYAARHWQFVYFDQSLTALLVGNLLFATYPKKTVTTQSSL